MPTYVEPETGDLNAKRTEGRIPAMEYVQSQVEHTLILNRGNESLQMAVQHFDDVKCLRLVVLDSDLDLCLVKQEIELSFDEVKLLRKLFNRPEVSAILEQSGKA